MPLIPRIRSLWRNLAHRAGVERDLDDELRSMFELLVDEKLRAGMDGREARRAALLELGGIDAVKERVREGRAGAWVDGLRRDVRYAVRVLARGRLFTAAAVLTLALGVGANSAMFGVVNALLLRPLPYPESDRLVWIIGSIRGEDLGAWREGLRTLERVGAFDLHTTVRTGGGAAERVEGMVVTADVMPLLGAKLVSGRLWTADEHRPGAAPAVLVRQRLWQRLGPGEARAGEVQVTLDGTSYTIIGVLPDDFQDLHYDSDVWFPAPSVPLGRANLIGARRVGASVADVRAEAEALADRIDVPAAASRFARAPNVTSLTEFFTAEIRTRLLVLFAATALVLLIACANVASLLLSRAVGRRRELALRSTLGAGKGTLLRQLLTEATVLATAGAVAGWVVAMIGMRIALHVAPEFYGFRRLDAVRLDRGVFAFALLAAWGTTLAAALLPALRTAGDAARAASGWARASATRGARRSREALMAAEIALALVLLVGTLLLVRTFLELRPASPGFEPEDRLVASIERHADGLPNDAARADFALRLLRETAATAPRTRIAIATDVPLSRSIMNFQVLGVDGERVEAGDPLVAGRGNLDLVLATPNYFDVLGIPLLRGRPLSDGDLPGSPPAIVVSESAARRYWGEANPLGRRITLDLGERTAEFVVVAVAGDTRSSGAHTRSRATGIASFWQFPWDGFQLVVHQPNAGTIGAQSIRDIVASIDPNVPVGRIEMLDRIAARAVASPRYDALLMSIIALLAVTLALIGCYGVVAYAVAQRTREIGVRIALGATHDLVMRTVLSRGAAIVAVGLAAGSALAFAVTRLLESSLYGVTPTDPASFAAALAGLAIVSLLAVYLPARRAARVQPIEALRVD